MFRCRLCYGYRQKRIQVKCGSMVEILNGCQKSSITIYLAQTRPKPNIDTGVANSSRLSGTPVSPPQAALSYPDSGSATAVGNSPPVSTSVSPAAK